MKGNRSEDPGRRTGSGNEQLTPRAAFVAARSAVSLAWRSAPAHMTGLVVVAVAGAGVPVGVAWLTRLVLDRLTGVSGTALLGLALGVALLGLVAALLPHLGQYLGTRLNRAAGLRAVNRLFTVVNSFGGLARFEDPRFQDRLRMAQSAGSQTVGRVVETGLRIAGGGLGVVGFVIALFVISPVMTGLVVAAAVPALAAEFRLSRLRARSAWRISSAQRREFFYQSLLSSLDAAKEIRLFAAGDFFKHRMLDERRAADAERRLVERRELVTQSGLAVLSALVSGGGLVWAVLAARQGRLSVGDVSMFVAAVVGVQGAMSGLVGSLADGHHQLLLLNHYMAVLGAGPDLPPPAGLVHLDTLPALRRGIELRDVWFRYGDGCPWVLRGVNLFLPRGAAVALVGHNGAGKSTLVKLLCRFYDPTRGEILWDGVDIRRVPVHELRRRLGAVFQDYMNYDLTAGENIAVGDVRALGDPAKLATAAREAGVHDVVAKLPHGYDTMLSRLFAAGDADDDTGALLSGGQWQRLALARAFLRTEPDLLILDEPSSGLDAEAEYDIHLRLRRYRADRTSLLISHRLGAVRDADRIVVLADGRITEEGSHAELLDADGTYARLFTVQANGYQP
ncbi:ABC transporter ATP-binding protein [Streptomyces actinomycinicus]|uniref:ABC transporter ATP-binding protein n=1 Tax=Streptomyces actinomycinicus TaxID=1695166 RepID=A0A937EHQ7_9ACTN|nr:ABC transporter ATP-binding protein [Streptomyces actinomycinicus]MBL1082295.1 ABC transporter ATP-binding protein [Streptomyces actinomycinicus]